MGMIPNAFIDDLIARVDIVDIIDSALPLRRSGKNYAACCPFHKEKTPSFTVSPDKQFYYCFGCGANGNAIGFLMDYHHQSFVDAVESLAQRAGLEVPREINEKQSRQHNQNKILYEILEKASDWYQQQLRSSPDKELAVNYLKGRGLSGQIAKEFLVGYAPPGWNGLLNAESLNKFRPEQFVEAGLSICKNEQGSHDKALQYDRFRDRIMYPIRDSRGRVIAFGGRVLGDDKPKYLNSPETPVFSKGKELYGLYEAKQADNKLSKIVVVEGYMDVIALAQMGIKNAVATLGTAISSEHLHLIFRTVSEVVFCFDGDSAGLRAAERALHTSLPFAQDGRQVRFLFLASGEDPDSMVRKEGPELFRHQMDNAKPLSEFLFEYASQGINLTSMDGKATLAKAATPLINQIPKGIFYEMMVARLAEITQLDSAIIIQSLKDAQQVQVEKAALASPARSIPASNSNPSRTPGSRENPKPESAFQSAPPLSTYNSSELAIDEDDRDFYGFDEQQPGFVRQHKRIPAILKVLTHLLRQPQLAKTSEIPEEVYKLKASHIDLLVEVLSYIRESEKNVSTAMLLGKWHNTPEGFLLASLAAEEPLLSPAELEQEFKGVLNQLINQYFSQEVSLVKGHSPEEKQRLKELLQEKAHYQQKNHLEAAPKQS